MILLTFTTIILAEKKEVAFAEQPTIVSSRIIVAERPSRNASQTTVQLRRRTSRLQQRPSLDDRIDGAVKINCPSALCCCLMLTAIKYLKTE